jgi:hypothetical protein
MQSQKLINLWKEENGKVTPLFISFLVEEDENKTIAQAKQDIVNTNIFHPSKPLDNVKTSLQASKFYLHHRGVILDDQVNIWKLSSHPINCVITE